MRKIMYFYFIFGRWLSTCRVTNPTYCNVSIVPMVVKDTSNSIRFSLTNVFHDA